MRLALILAICFFTFAAQKYWTANVYIQDTNDKLDEITFEQSNEENEYYALPSITSTPTKAPEKENEDSGSGLSLVTEAKAQEVKIGVPIRLKIGKIRLNAPIIKEGKTQDGRMDVPADNATVGWWKFGRKPGEVGNAVLAGHYKVADGSPGVFYRLNELKIGDKITVVADDNRESTYVIRDLQIYSATEFPLKLVYSSRNVKEQRLNLITCTGEYISSINDYSHRLVVFTEMVE